MADLLPWRLTRLPSIWDEDEDIFPVSGVPGGLSVSEDDKHVYVEASLPGIDPKDIDITFDKGVVWIKGEAQEEKEEKKKYYRKATTSFSYRVAVPGEIDQMAEPDATYKNGVMKVIFAKSPAAQPRKIQVKAG